MPPNPFAAVAAYLRGADLQPTPPDQPAYRLDRAPPESKMLGTIDDIRAVFTANTMLVHGPGATAYYDALGGWGPEQNSAVFACLMARCYAYVEAPLRVWTADAQGQRVWQPDSPLQRLLDQPNPYMNGLELRFWTEYARSADGNAYWRKIRSGDGTRGNVVELWPISPRLIRPIRYKGSAKFIDAFRYSPTNNSQDDEDIDPANIIHFKLGMDDRNMTVGLSSFKRMLREVSSDDEATRFLDQLLGNYGVPGLVVTTPADANLTKADAVDLKQRVTEDFRGQNRGSVSVLSPGAGIQQFGFNPEQMDLRTQHYIPETRIAAVLRVPPVVAGLAAGLEKSGQFSNFHEARAMFVEQSIAPAWTFDSAKVNGSLARDFDASGRLFTAHDLTDVRALQEDEDAKWKRLDAAVQGLRPWVKPSEARADVGLPPDPALDAAWLAGIGGSQPAPAPAADALPPTKERQIVEMKGLEQWPELMRAMVDLAEPQFRADMEAYFDEQRRRIKRRILGTPEVRSLPDPEPAALPAPANPNPVPITLTVRTPLPDGRTERVRKDVERDSDGRIIRVVEYHDVPPTEEVA